MIIGNFNTIGEFTEIKSDSHIFHNSSIGVIPQDKKFGGERSKLIIGKRTIVREFVTLNRGTKATGKTVIGDDVLIMTGVHVAHDCVIGNNVILVNLVAIVQDVPPFILAGRHPVEYTGINTLGLKRRGFSQEERTAIKKAYRYYFRSDLNASDSLKTIKNEFKGK